ncbi:methyltransferase, FkbM family [Cnuella takakiae]|uniref:Methyltransferase, FkbM family n=1 Tax=Cnuella takakiae TaxID=1302690 RepID=A0A1M4VBP5_9BACT|nr:FkbM family methyltransferase [Cnuella takakiae]SHE66278.1 methyltransferase, FkbM family [Cnuella takakiae]
MPVSQKAVHNGALTWYTVKVLKHQDDQLEKHLQLDPYKVFYQRPYELLHTYSEIFTNGIYHFRASRENPLIIDCGSNIGIGLLNYKAQYPQARIIGFEPDKGNFALLQKNIKHNKLEGVTLHQAAVWTSNGTISFASEASEASHIAEDGSGGQIVTAIRLADILAAEDKIDFLKIDIEGAEWPVIQDCAPYLGKVDNLFLEYHGKTTETSKLTGIMQILEKAGYSVYVQNAADNLARPFLQKTTGTIYDVQLNLYCFKA